MLGKLRYIFSTIFFVNICISSLWAQNHADCVGAKTICGSQTVTLLSTTIGDIDDKAVDDFGCMSWGENGTVWYKFKIGIPGFLTFTITPAVASDYDWALWGPFPDGFQPCGGNLGAPLRCNASGYNVPTGLADTTLTSSSGGGDTNPWSRYIDVQKDEVYYLVLDNCGFNPLCNPTGVAGGGAFTLSWGGTARLANIEGDYTATINCRTTNFNPNLTTCYTDLQYRWDFGDGNKSSLPNPTHTYLHAGTYTSKLMVWSASDSASSSRTFPDKTILIRNEDMFGGNFTYSVDCKRISLNAPPSCLTNIVEYEWDMGDGKPLVKTTIPKIDYLYGLGGNYMVNLKIKTADNAFFSFSNTVSVPEPPFTVDFANTKDCRKTTFKPTVTTCFKGLTYAWDLGNGTTSTDIEPSVFYTAEQDYTVNLKIKADNGEEKTISKTYKYQNPSIDVDFTITKECQKTIFKAITNTCLTGALDYEWDLGNGTTSTDSEVSIFYTALQEYTVKLKVRSLTDNASNTATKTYQYENPPIVLSFTETIACKTVQFTPKTETCLNITEYFWEFGDGKTSTEKNPNHEYAEDNKNFIVKLKVKTDKGLEQTFSKNITIPKLLKAAFDAEVKCKNVVFKNLSASCDPAASYTWDFGDGSFSTDKNPSHLYDKNGNYTIFLTAQNTDGTTETFAKNVSLSTADFTLFMKVKQNCTEIAFEAVTPDCYVINYEWDFGDGASAKIKNIKHTYEKYGSYKVKIRATNSFGQVIELEQPVVVKAPQLEGDFEYTVLPNKCREVQFKNTIKTCAKLTTQWTFQDKKGNIVHTSTEPNPTVTFSKNGKYKVTLTVVNADGSLLEFSKTISVDPPIAMSISEIADEYDIDDPKVKPAGSPAGGKFFINEKEIEEVNFAEIGAGEQELEYRVVDPTLDCTFTAFHAFKVNPLPFVTIDSLQHIFCPNDPVFALKGTPEGGKFSIGTDTTAIREINPAFLSAGVHAVRYALTDPKRTVTSISFITVRQVPKLYFLNIINDSIRIDQPPFEIMTEPKGGKVLIKTDTTQKVDPAALGLGEHRFQYFFQDSNLCVTVLDKKILVYPVPELTFLNVPNRFCQNDPPFFLSASPAGGQFFLDGKPVENHYFEPAKITTGDHSLKYRFADRHNLPLETEKLIKVFEVPKPKIVNLENKKAICINAEAIKLEGSPSGKGGYFKIDNRKTEYFYPSEWKAGAHRLTFVYTNENNCTDSVSQFLTVLPQPFITISNLQSEYCGTDTNRIVLKGVPEGGKFMLNGSFTSVLVPSNWGSGRIKVSYIYQDEKACVWTIDHNVQILEVPKLQILGLQNLYCLNESRPFVPKANLDSGVWQIRSQKVEKVNPQSLGAGEFELRYTYIDSNRCAVSTFETLKIVENPKFRLLHLKGDGCYRTDTLRLVLEKPRNKKITWLKTKSFYRILNDTAVVVNKTGIYTASVLDSLTGCTTLDSVKIIINPLPTVEIPDVPYLCYGTSKILGAGAGFKAYAWRDSTGKQLSANQFFTVSEAQKYTVTVTNEFGCTASDTFRIAKILPPVFVKISGDSTICQDENQAILVADKGFAKYEWRLGKTGKWENTQNNNTFSAKNLGVYWLRATDIWGCVAEDTITVSDCCEPTVDIPNAFTPHNSAGKNDLYRIKHLNIKHFKLQIYNRWGILIFETSDPEEGWNGTYQGQKMPSDAYQVLIEFSGCNQKGAVRKREMKALHLLE